MSETNSTPAPQEALSDEERVIAMFGLDEDDPLVSADEDGEQPDEGAASDEDQPDTEEDGAEPQQAAVDPPAFWTKEAKEHWAQIPPETQSYLVGREAERDAATQRAQNEAADVRRQADALASEIAQERAYMSQQVAPALQAVTQRLMGDYSPERLAELARTNPAEWAAQVAERDRLAYTQQQLQAEETRTRQMAVMGEMERLKQAVPEWRDQATAAKGMTDMVSLAGEFSYSPQEISGVSDHRAFLVLKALHDTRAKLAAYEAAKDAPARKAVQQVVTRPVNATRPRTETNTGQMSRQQIMAAARSGDSKAQEAAVAQLLGLRG